MPEDRFAAYRAHLTKHYAQEKVEAGQWPQAEAVRRAQEDIDKLLPDGTHTEGHFLYSLKDESSTKDVGNLWLTTARPDGGRSVWIYDIEIFERFRRMGYGRRALEAAENEARALGAESIDLHVFGHNKAARALYESAGYVTTNLNMKKEL